VYCWERSIKISWLVQGSFRARAERLGYKNYSGLLDSVYEFSKSSQPNLYSGESEVCSCRSHTFFYWYSGGGVQLGPLGTAATNRPIVPSPSDYDDGEIGGVIGRGNRSTRRKAAPVLLCLPQTPHACPDANPSRRCGKSATNRLSYGTASKFYLM
jgi:hypothetical protein